MWLMGYKEVFTFILSASVVVGCGGSRVEASKTNETPTLTPVPNPNNLIVESPTPENNFYLGTPGAIETQIVSTAEAADLENSKAVSSLVSIALFSDNGLSEASGNLAYLFGYPVILTSGHIYGHLDAQGFTAQRLSVKRLNISNPISLSFSKYKEAHIYDGSGTYRDIGIFVITDPDETEYLTDAISIDQMLTLDDLRFDQMMLGESVNGICYPSPSYPNPYPFEGSIYGSWNSQVVVDDALTAHRCSGGGLFDSNGKYFASVSGGYDFNQFKEVDQSRWNDTFVFPLSSIGEAGLEQLVAQAVSK